MFGLKKHLKVSSLSVGILLTIFFVLFYAFFHSHVVKMVSFLDLNLLNKMVKYKGVSKASTSITIIDIDEKSLSQLGQWPWPRKVIADLLYKLKESKTRINGFDIVFAEADRTSLKNLIKGDSDTYQVIQRELGTKRNWDNDISLGKAVSETNTVLGFSFILEELEHKGTSTPFPDYNPAVDEFGSVLQHCIVASDTTANIEVISNNSLSEAYFTAPPDSTGIIRSIPLLIKYDDRVFPSMALELARLGKGVAVDEVKVVSSNELMRGVDVRGSFIPTSENGFMFINFRGPAQTFNYISAVDVLNGTASKQLLNGQYVVIGSTAVGLHDLRRSPFGVMPGVEILANSIDNVIEGDPMVYSLSEQMAFTILMILVFGIVISIVTSTQGALSSFLLTTLGGLLIVIINYKFFFLNNHIVNISYSYLSLYIIFTVVSLTKTFYEGKASRFIKKAFSLYLSKELVEKISKNPESLTLDGVEQELTILFSDIRSFTTISETLSAKQLGEFLNGYFTEMSDIIMNEKGYIDKYIGDAIMAIWGAPVSDAMQEKNAVYASLKMLKALHNLQEEWKSKKLPVLEIGIGINTAPVCVGNFGSKRQFNYTVIGDGVNLASRLEGLNKNYGTHLLVSESTYMKVKEEFTCRFIDVVRVKGKHIPVKIYEPMLKEDLSEKQYARIDDFHYVLELYHQQKFETAKQLLLELQAQDPQRLYQVYLERIELFEKEPPVKDWDGVFTFEHK